MNGYEIPVNENTYSSREYYLNNKKQKDDLNRMKLEYSNFVNNSRSYFLAEAMNFILQKSLDEDTTQENREYGKALIEGFIEENGSAKLVKEFGRKTLLTAGIADIVNEAHQQVLHSCKEGDSKTFRISKTVDDKFFDKINGLSDFKICEKINQRVCDSIENYVQDNVNDKLDLDELADKTKERIDNIKAKNSKERDKIVECYTEQYNRAVNDIKKRSHRKVGIYEQILHSVTNGVVSDNTILESFTTEAGTLDMEKIRGKVTVMYTFLEMLNTAKMANVNEAYIENIIKNI